jgi:hypothetical protein
MLIAYLASFLGVSPFRETQDPMVDIRLDLLFSEAMDKLHEVDDEACMKYVARKILAWYTKYPPKNEGAAAAVEASAAPPPCTPVRGPVRGPRWAPPEMWQMVARPSPMMRAKPKSNCGINRHCRLADPDQGRGKWEGGFLARSMLCNMI